MASQFWQPGTVALLVGPQNASTGQAVFCGAGTFSPETEFLPKFKPIHDDYSGSMISADESFGGEEAFVSIDFARYDMAGINIVANYLVALADFNAANGVGKLAGTRGQYVFGDIGTLMQTEGYYMTIFLLNLNMLPVGFPGAFPNQPLGYRMPCCRPAQLTLPRKDLVENQITRAAFEAKNLRAFNLPAQPGLPAHTCYNVLSAGDAGALAGLLE